MNDECWSVAVRPWSFSFILPLLLLPLLAWFARPLVLAAHAELLAADPPPGAQLASPPALIRLTFSEPLGPGSGLTLRRPDFSAVPIGAPAIDPQAPQQLTAVLPLLEPAVYVVHWQAVSADGHTVAGSYQFSVGAPPHQPQRLFWPWWLLLGAAVLLAAAGVGWRRARNRGRYMTDDKQPTTD